MKTKLAAILMAFSLSGCSSLMGYQNTSRGVQADEVIINAALYSMVYSAGQLVAESWEE